MKKLFQILILIIPAYFLYQKFSTPSTFDLLKKEIIDISQLLSTKGQIPPIKILKRNQAISKKMHNEIYIFGNTIDQEQGKPFEFAGAKNVKPYIPLILKKIKDFNISIISSKLTSPLTVRVKIQAQGEIIDYMEYFSEMRTLKVTFVKVHDEFLIKKVELEDIIL